MADQAPQVYRDWKTKTEEKRRCNDVNVDASKLLFLIMTSVYYKDACANMRAVKMNR